MSQDQIILMFYLASLAARIPRFIERWEAPLLRGTDWFFSVAVPPGFYSQSSAPILRRYHRRLIIPTVIETFVCLAILAAGVSHHYILWTVLIATLLNRIYFYIARKAAEDQVRRITHAAPQQAPVVVALSLQPRSLLTYTNPWIEAFIFLLIGGSTVWAAARYISASDWLHLRDLLTAAILEIYVQVGLVLLKSAFVRARVSVPAEGADQYLAWRESLRRLSTSLCDYLRVGIALLLSLAAIVKGINPSNVNNQQVIIPITTIALALVATIFEWRVRLRHLNVARRTKPPQYLSLPQLPDAATFFCFRPSLPVLLLNSPRGYTVNLASSSAKIACLYIAGYAALLLLLTHMSA